MLGCGGCAANSCGLGVSGRGPRDPRAVGAGGGGGLCGGVDTGAAGDTTGFGGAAAGGWPEESVFSIAASCRSSVESRSETLSSGNVRSCSDNLWTRTKAEIARMGVMMTRATARKMRNSMMVDPRKDELEHSYGLQTTALS